MLSSVVSLHPCSQIVEKRLETAALKGRGIGGPEWSEGTCFDNFFCICRLHGELSPQQFKTLIDMCY